MPRWAVQRFLNILLAMKRLNLSKNWTSQKTLIPVKLGQTVHLLVRLEIKEAADHAGLLVLPKPSLIGKPDCDIDVLKPLWFLELVYIPMEQWPLIFPLKIFFPVVDTFAVTDVMVVSHRPPGNTGFKMDSSPEVFMAERVVNHMLLNHVNITLKVIVPLVLARKEPLHDVSITAKIRMA